MSYVAAVSLALGTLTFIGFLLFTVIYWFKGVTGRALVLATTLTLVWFGMRWSASTELALIGEGFATTAWIVLLCRALGISFSRKKRGTLQSIAIVSALVPLVCAIFALLELSGLFTTPTVLVHITMLVANIGGLVLIEQLSRNTVADLTWRIRYLNIGLGLIFGFGVLRHALELAIPSLPIDLYAIQPAVLAVATPFLAIASLRNQSNQLKFNLSREFIFRTGVLATTGSFLLALSLLGYLAQIFAGDTGLTIATFLAIVGAGLLFALIGSSQFRSTLRVQMAKTFFAFRYDYRDEWMAVTTRLTEVNPDYDLYAQIQRSFQIPLFAKRSALWILNADDNLQFTSHLNAPSWPRDLTSTVESELQSLFADQLWVLDRKGDTSTYESLNAQLIEALPEHRFIIPLSHNETLYGICAVGDSDALDQPLSWEDFDLLKLISRQCTGFLALHATTQALVEHEKFAAVNQMSAFLVHDIKTISAQLSLLTDNAAQHKSNPAFIDDMLATVENSVQRMQKIMRGLQEADTPEESPRTVIDVGTVLTEWLDKTYPTNPKIELQPENEQPYYINTQVDLLVSALSHIVQNSLEACSEPHQQVQINLHQDLQHVYIEIKDNGPGMTPEFVSEELFKPFRSSKGVTGMGIGAYQAKTNIKNCGGQLDVASEVDVGTTFSIRFPRSER